MKILTLPVGQQATNCYLLYDEESHHTLIIDPGDDAEYISSEITAKKLIPQEIILTHGHFDHCLGTLELSLNFNLPVALNPKDIFLYQRASKSAEYFNKVKSLPVPKITHSLTDGEIISVGNSQVSAIFTPGHTPGSICIHTPGLLVTGDTLFKDSIGDTHYRYSSPKDLHHSLKNIQKFPPDTTIHPGHGESGLLSDILC